MSIRSLLFNDVIKKSIYKQHRLFSCWSCGKDVQRVVPALFCGHCNAIQHPMKGENYFKLMGVSESYDLDENVLAKKYKELQRYLHPDKFASRAKQEQEISERYSSLVNEAYKTLLEPLTRGIYMLRLRGKDIPENTEVDQQFLMEIMEKNEEVESAESEEEIMALNKENKAKIKKLQKQVSTAFFEGDLKRVIKLLGIMKYYTSIDNQIQTSIRSKGIIR
ncbi:iron-sulfur cluster co-chaperone protein HscB, mitochondrial [Trichoplusia ni]|uniref:Iron-sulfur cluster co-chaperone protein HscB, mitochondrial n=1 Tax=Trichoplusia ni TaxID=7111 RepID=A0A7E5VJ95_TRINI|nr:iron-sulfur cluster co-chaperone protein HscB, mitochondrial [Trichoplusia ni]